MARMHPPRLSEKEYVILSLLRSGGERFGLELVKDSGGILKRGTIYVTLSRMAEKGFVTSRQEHSPGDPGMPRRYFSMSGNGALALRSFEAAMAVASNPYEGFA
jgi:PadR family transcriptional regulator, regulatory protein PadR